MQRMTPQPVPLIRLLRSSVGMILRELEQQLADRGWDDARTSWGFMIGRTDLGPTTINDLAEYLSVSKQAASKTVEQMERHGLVRLIPFPGDGRKRVIELTQDGQRFREDVYDILARIEISWATMIGDDGVHLLRDHLTTVLRSGEDGNHPPPAAIHE